MCHVDYLHIRLFWRIFGIKLLIKEDDKEFVNSHKYILRK